MKEKKEGKEENIYNEISDENHEGTHFPNSEREKNGEDHKTKMQSTQNAKRTIKKCIRQARRGRWKLNYFFPLPENV